MFQRVFRRVPADELPANSCGAPLDRQTTQQVCGVSARRSLGWAGVNCPLPGDADLRDPSWRAAAVHSGLPIQAACKEPQILPRHCTDGRGARAEGVSACRLSFEVTGWQGSVVYAERGPAGRQLVLPECLHRVTAVCPPEGMRRLL